MSDEGQQVIIGQRWVAVSVFGLLSLLATNVWNIKDRKEFKQRLADLQIGHREELKLRDSRLDDLSVRVGEAKTETAFAVELHRVLDLKYNLLREIMVKHGIDVSRVDELARRLERGEL